MRKTKKRFNYQPLLLAVASFFILVFVILRYTQFSNDNKEKDIRSNLLDLLITKKSQLEKALNSRVYYTKGIAAYTSINPHISNETFYELADELINKDSVISTMSLSRDCVINAIFPYEGHEAAIGLNLLEHPARRKIVEKTIETRNTFIAGPVKLIEGGIAFISYTPIFSRKNHTEHNFWGVTDIVVWKDKLLNEIKLLPDDGQYKYALRGIDGTGKEGEVFFGNSTLFDKDPVTVDVLLPTGSWQLAAIPCEGWKTYLDKTEVITIILYISAFIISILIWLLSKAFIKIRTQEKELKALFGSMNDHIFVLNTSGVFIKAAPTKDIDWGISATDVVGKKISDFFEKEIADSLLQAVRECISTKEVVPIDYPIMMEGKEHWFHARISYISDDSVIFISHDDTNKILAEEQLRKSEQRLAELNAAKDKLFSIIAHDLRGPFGVTMGLSEILHEDIDSLGKEEIVDYSGEINKALNNQYRLLENLLNWAGMQSGRIEFDKKEIYPASVAKEVVDVLEQSAKAKSIELNCDADDTLSVEADNNMFRSLLQNLLNNAIKFTPRDGKIDIAIRKKEEEVEIEVADSGVGMSKEDISKIFNVGAKSSTFGTEGEKGTGIGLPLIKEIVDKHSGKIEVLSEIGKGTRFIITLPKS